MLRKKVSIKLSNQEEPFLYRSDKKSDFPIFHLFLLLLLSLILFGVYKLSHNNENYDNKELKYEKTENIKQKENTKINISFKSNLTENIKTPPKMSLQPENNKEDIVLNPLNKKKEIVKKIQPENKIEIPTKSDDKKINDFSKLEDIDGRYYFVELVKNREPVNRIYRFKNNKEITFYTSILNQKGKKLKHIWYFDGVKVFEKEFEIKGNRWRVWTTKNIWDDNAIVTVEIQDSEENVLVRKSIRK